jgi:uncharacterized protein with FMN-binding domain
MNSQRAQYPFAILSGLALVGALAGCSAADTDAPAAADTDSGGSTSAPDASDSGASTGGYTDGTYTEDAEYTSPGGTEEIEVTVTLADGVITEVEVVGDGDNPNSKRYQGEFADGIGDVVVGKSIDEISVDKVAGSSLTSSGFNDAIEEIKADAAS